MKANDRLHALKILTALMESRKNLSHLMSLQDISPLTKEICYGFCRHYFRLQSIADTLITKRPKDNEVWIVLLIGIYQLQYMNKPDYAVVKETVSLLGQVKKIWAKGLVNAVLRNFCRRQDPILEKLSGEPVFIYGQPNWLLQRLQKDWPNDWQFIADANDRHPPMTLRVNVLKNSVDEYLDLLKKSGIEAFKHPVAPDGITLAIPCDVTTLPGFAQGFVSVQDAAPQLAAYLLSLKSGQRVLDACCAPGGKTCHILEREPGLASCVALDLDPQRLQRVRDNLNRLGLQATIVQGDVSEPKSWWDGHPFDRILLDAPCSATGVIRRHSDIKLLRTDEEVLAITRIQYSMLNSLWPLLAPGGLMVYATCSIMSDENELQIARFVAEHPDCQVSDDKWSWGRWTGHGQQILPGEQGMDGFFYSVLRKDEK
ncbi:TPA: 16S rRNA (cytosine(967)-C(5))-methyltransferase RsmB [Legionella pneumophila]|nr:16S rRNA (cytosine(967)-C(5))-methyltransferase RsmB [Legionella pneumophila subsp. fraseri]HAT1660048.1 16S rRNA (cytosine(967)-C(5))-methyltransferase RsmB [Legionella pneumophila]MDW8961874.1 16S rRNA (cytosine(967)-C(5))-methyltransferase RsmB [Legionella pneumophila subsp. fraseri]MDW9035585.1 16S rRNA (cytosine(967)-C(5))-methyltransferase RsmB [Legionella pneumophila subsp. fraseri]MDW9039218.1 16S rRNA (cytosine(967)-C(5))-methyltransferase RsmB [Legionella pneumophila subsp. fraseri